MSTYTVVGSGPEVPCSQSQHRHSEHVIIRDRYPDATTCDVNPKCFIEPPSLPAGRWPGWPCSRTPCWQIEGEGRGLWRASRRSAWATSWASPPPPQRRPEPGTDPDREPGPERKSHHTEDWGASSSLFEGFYKHIYLVLTAGQLEGELRVIISYLFSVFVLFRFPYYCYLIQPSSYRL